MSAAKRLEIRSLLPLFTLILSQLDASLAFSQCYYPDGSIPTDYVWEPCTGSQFSSCCIPSEGDICQENGLCYYPPYGQVYRGACTDRTWNDPACPSDICVTGFETSWTWTLECSENGSTKNVCGVVDDIHETATCASNATPLTASYITDIPKTTASRYVAPPSINTALYSLYTESYTVVITANVQTTTLTSTYESTLTSTLPQTASTTSSSSPSGGATNAASKQTPAATKDKVTLTTGVLVAIIAGPIAAIIIAVGIFFWCRKRSARKNAIKLSDEASYPPANGPVGKDQVHPYEVPVNEATGYQKQPQAYTYVAPPVQEHSEVHGAYGASQEKKWGQAVEMGNYEYGGLNSPQPRSPQPPSSPAPGYYHQAAIAVELDGTSSVRGRNEL